MARTHVVLDDELVAQGLDLSGLPTRRALVHEALAHYVRWLERRKLVELRGRVEFELGSDPQRLRAGRKHR